MNNSHIYTLFDPHEVFEETLKIYRSLIAGWGEDKLREIYFYIEAMRPGGETVRAAQSRGIESKDFFLWRMMIRQLQLNDEDFRRWFVFEYRLETMAGGLVKESLENEDFLRADQAGIIPRDCLLEFMMDGQICMPQKISMLTNPSRNPYGRRLIETYPVIGEMLPPMIDRIVSVEEKRGELPTILTGHCSAIARFEGAEHFCNLLAALGKGSFYRGYEYASNSTKQSTLSSLLKKCYPAKDDTPEKLCEMLKKTDISGKRLAEAVMYAPQWAGFAEEVLDWPGLKCGVWFFHAHINESFTAEKETEAAIYSPISPQQFNDGAFDKHWFFEAYDQLGEEKFQILYNAAKYITTGSNQHRRSQLYSDAVLGRLDAGELLQEITEKRNQERLRCFR